MICLKNDDLKEMIAFAESLGLVVNTKTKARGHHGFFMKNRIDISKELTLVQKKRVFVHEFAHFIHYKLEPGVIKNHGTLKILFDTPDSAKIKEELEKITFLSEENPLLKKLEQKKREVLSEIKVFDLKIKAVYPDFRRSASFKELECKIKRTDAKYLLKYDKVRVKTSFWGGEKVFSIQTLDDDFKSLDNTAKNYIRLKSKQRLLNRISSRINKLKKYYLRPSELFARFVQNVYSDTQFVKETAPCAFERFIELLQEGYYFELEDFFMLFAPLLDFQSSRVQCEL